MRSDNGITQSKWMADLDVPELQPISRDERVDVCVIGSGIAGMSVGYHLTREGKSVLILDDGPLAGGETCRTTAHLSNAIDDRYFELERVHGQPMARLAADSHTQAINRIEQIVAEEGIDCDFTRLDGYLFLVEGDGLSTLEKELAAAHRAGLGDVRMVERVPYDGYKLGPALVFPQQGQFHVLKYIMGLVRAFVARGGRLMRAHATAVEGGKPARVRTSAGHTVTADSVVVATNTPVNDRVTIHTKQYPYRTYVIGARVPKAEVPTALLWDTGDPYHYVRLQDGGEREPGHDILIVGGEDHKTGMAEDYNQFPRLEQWTRARFPVIDVPYRWSGQVMETQDYVAFIGRNPLDSDNVYIATGDSGMGMTHGTIAGMLITDLILGRANPWAELYDPARKRFTSEFVTENLQVAENYMHHLAGSEVDSVEQIRPGEGAIVRRGLKKIAVYRADDGTLHERLAICPHLGGMVHWNPVEKTWDCGAHGSRFRCDDGCVVNGPANSGLLGPDESLQSLIEGGLRIVAESTGLGKKEG